MKKYSILDIEMYDFISHDRFIHDNYLYNLDKTKFIVSYVGNQPTFISGYEQYTYDEVYKIIYDKNSNWFSKEEV